MFWSVIMPCQCYNEQFLITPHQHVFFSSHHFLDFSDFLSSRSPMTGHYKHVDEATRIGRYGRHKLRKREYGKMQMELENQTNIMNQ